MKEDYKKYRKIPPYTTKTGVKIGLLYQEPFEARIDRDAYKFQEAFLKNCDNKRKQPIHYGDLAVGITSVILLIALIVLGVFHVL